MRIMGTEAVAVATSQTGILSWTRFTTVSSVLRSKGYFRLLIAETLQCPIKRQMNVLFGLGMYPRTNGQRDPVHVL